MPTTSAQTFPEVDRRNELFFDDLMKTANKAFKDIFAETKHLRIADVGEGHDKLNEVLSDISCEDELIENLNIIKMFDVLTLKHSVNVTIYSLILGLSNKYFTDSLEPSQILSTSFLLSRSVPIAT